MNMYYFGQSHQYIETEYATSNRSACRGCKGKINKDELRIGLILDDDHFSGKYWYHLNCFTLKPRHREIDPESPEQKIYNIDQLEPEDFDKVVEHIKKQLERLKSGKKAPKIKAAASSVDDKNAKETKLEKASKSKPKKKKKQQSSSEQEEESQESFSPDSSEKPSKKAKAAAKKKKAAKKSPARKSAYTEQQQELFQKYSDEYSKLTIPELKELLAVNRQSKNGTKSELVEKCADGKVLGQIPLCTKCGGGRLRFDIKNGKYTCPGYMEDTDFIRCNGSYEFDEIKRNEWIENS